MGKIKSILFVCTGTSCRSVIAEGLMRKYLKELGKDYIEVQSAGASAIDLFPPTDETVKVMKENDIDVSGYRSKKVGEELVNKADLILVMEDRHKDFIGRMFPAASSKTHLLKEYGMQEKPNYPEGPNIPDPIGKPIEYYRLSFAVINDQIKRIAEVV